MAAELGISFLDIGILVFFGAVASILAVRLRIPPVLALLAAGVAIGPHALGFISNTDSVALSAEIGAVLLLFTIGAEFSVAKLRSFGLKAFSIGFIKLAIVFWLSHQTAILFGLDGSAALYMAAILAITSTALTLKILEQQGLAKRAEVPYLLASLVIEDLFAIFALVFFSASSQAEASPLGLLTSLFAALAVLAVAFLVVLRILNKTLDWVTRYQAEETMLFLGLALAIGFSYLAQQVGLTSSIGAFLAGSLVASLPKGKILEHSLAPFALAFTAIFFVSIGLSVNLQSLADHAVLVVVFSVLGAAYRFFGAGTAMYLNGFSSQSAAFSGLAMMSAGEFSLVIAGTGAAAVAAFDLVSVTGGIVFISTLLMSISVPRHEAVHRHLSALMPASLDRAAKRSAAALVAIVNAFATLPKTARENIHDFKWNLAIASVIVAAMAVGLWLARRVEVNVFGATVQGYVLILATGGLLLLPFLLRIADEGYQVLSQVERKTRNASASNWMAAVGFVLLLLIVPFALRHAGRELLLGEIVLLVLVLCAIFYILNLKTPNAKSKSIFLRDPRWKNSAGEKTISRPEHRWKR